MQQRFLFMCGVALLFILIAGFTGVGLVRADAPGTRGTDPVPQGGIAPTTGHGKPWTGVRELPLPSVLFGQIRQGQSVFAQANLSVPTRMTQPIGTFENGLLATESSWIARLPNVGNWSMDVVLGGASGLTNSVNDAIIEGVLSLVGGPEQFALSCEGGGNNMIVCVPPALFFGRTASGFGFGTIIPTLWDRFRPLEIGILTMLFALRLSRMLKNGPQSFAIEGKDLVVSFVITVLLIVGAEHLLTLIFSLFNSVHSLMLGTAQESGLTLVKLLSRVTQTSAGLNFAASFTAFVLVAVLLAVVISSIARVIKLGVLVLIAPIMAALYFDPATRSRFTAWAGRLFDVLLSQTVTVFFLVAGSLLIVDQPGIGGMVMGSIVIGLALGGETLLAGIAGAGAATGGMGLVGAIAGRAGKIGAGLAVRPVAQAATQALPPAFRKGSKLTGAATQRSAPRLALTPEQIAQGTMTSPLTVKGQHKLAGQHGMLARQRYASEIRTTAPHLPATQVQQQAAWRAQAAAMADAATDRARHNRQAARYATPETRTALLQAAERQERAAERRRHFALTGHALPMPDPARERRSSLLRNHLVEARHETGIERDQVKSAVRVAGERLDAIPAEIARTHVQTTATADHLRAQGRPHLAAKERRTGEQRVAMLHAEHRTLEARSRALQERLRTLTPPLLDARGNRTAADSAESRRLAVERTQEQLRTGGRRITAVPPSAAATRPVVSPTRRGGRKTHQTPSVQVALNPIRATKTANTDRVHDLRAQAQQARAAGDTREAYTLTHSADRLERHASPPVAQQARRLHAAQRGLTRDRVGRAGYRDGESAPVVDPRQQVSHLRVQAAAAKTSGEARLAQLQRTRAGRLEQRVAANVLASRSIAPSPRSRPSPVVRAPATAVQRLHRRIPAVAVQFLRASVARPVALGCPPERKRASVEGGGRTQRPSVRRQKS